ncbi:uncharacterized protein EV420DRAFT_1488578 [Desarmillaria tabescens]|uniref:Uncharacterized protein n=1 Tax=Armillaria tabescens TaxID=1929756 RepID=A0AA39J5G1_ARMTA|nr:uncharacterized protein EV420DRAFT_1488578 [Desarmillaria tabescens]KAK0434668.1 hypothetical protein EV420DRAFT_1488578 [Desarmillaria tabescens]
MEKIIKWKLILQLYVALPPQYHVFVGGTIPGSYHKLAKIMKGTVMDICPIFINWVKTHGAVICEGIVPSNCFGQDFDQYTDLLCRKLVGYEPGKEKLARLCPCLYELGKRIGGDTLFRSPATVKILTCLLWGASALRAKRFQTKTTYGELWTVTEVTPAAIAFAVIVLRFLLSGDPSFTLDRGARSKINYFSDFEFYVSTIEKKLMKGSKSMLATIQLYNEQIFPTAKHTKSAALSLKANLEENSDEEEMLKGLDNIDAEVFSDDDDFECDVPAITNHVLDSQASVQMIPAPITTTSVVEAGSVPLAQPCDTTTKEKRGRKKANPIRSGNKDGTQVVPMAAVVKVENEEKEASKNEDEDDGEGNGNDEDEDEEEEDLEYVH